jgi:hypothetical protein
MAVSNFHGVSPSGFKAGGSISINTFVKLDSTAGQVVASSAATDKVRGVALQAASTNDSVPVQTFGRAKITAGEAISLGAEVMSGTGGKAYTLSGATAYVLGQALTAAAADGDVIEIWLNPYPVLNT